MTNFTMFYADYTKQNPVNQPATNFRPVAQQPQQQFGVNPNVNFKPLAGKSLFNNPQNYDVGLNNNAKFNFNDAANMGNKNNYGYMFNGNNFYFGNFYNVAQPIEQPVAQKPVTPPPPPPEKVGENMKITYTGDPHLNAFIDKNGDGKFDDNESIGKIDNMEQGPQQLIGDNGINLVANQVPWSGNPEATVVGSTDLTLGNNKFLFNPDGSVTLNGNPYTVPEGGWTDGTNKVMINGKAYDVTTPEYAINIANNGDHQNLTVQTTANGINGDYTKPVGLFGDVFANESIKPLQDLDVNKDGYIKNGEGAKYAKNQQPIEDVVVDEPFMPVYNGNQNYNAPINQLYPNNPTYPAQNQNQFGASSTGGSSMNMIMQLLMQLMSMLGMGSGSMGSSQGQQTGQKYYYNNF